MKQESSFRVRHIFACWCVRSTTTKKNESGMKANAKRARSSWNILYPSNRCLHFLDFSQSATSISNTVRICRHHERPRMMQRQLRPATSRKTAGFSCSSVRISSPALHNVTHFDVEIDIVESCDGSMQSRMDRDSIDSWLRNLKALLPFCCSRRLKKWSPKVYFCNMWNKTGNQGLFLC